jgi:mono/diheme cytochrome c family protein
MWKNVLVVSAVCLAALLTFGQDTSKPAQTAPPSNTKIPDEAIKEPNPVKPTPESIEHGKKLYGYDCAMCHGAAGDGKGDLATDIKLQVDDFRNPKILKDKTDGEIFYIIKNGQGQMPGERDRATTNQIWDLVNYIRTFAKKEAPKAAEQAAATNPQ